MADRRLLVWSAGLAVAGFIGLGMSNAASTTVSPASTYDTSNQSGSNNHVPPTYEYSSPTSTYAPAPTTTYEAPTTTYEPAPAPDTTEYVPTPDVPGDGYCKHCPHVSHPHAPHISRHGFHF